MSKVKSHHPDDFNWTFYNIIIVILSMSFLYAGCNEKEILPEEKFIAIYVDMLVAQDTVSGQSSSLDSIKAVILSRHSTSDIVYKNTVNYHNESAERWEQFFDNAVAYVQELKSKTEE